MRSMPYAEAHVQLVKLLYFFYFLSVKHFCQDEHIASAGQASITINCAVWRWANSEIRGRIIVSGWCLHEHISAPSQVNKAHRGARTALDAWNMQLVLSCAQYSEVKCNNTAIMHIWYLKSSCLMVIFVLNWIYNKMCSDMKHVAAGPVGKKASDREINRISE